MNRLKYIGYLGEIDLNSDDIKLLTSSDFFNYSYKVETISNIGGSGERLKSISLPSRQLSFTLLFKGLAAKEQVLLLNSYFARDIERKVPGKLMFNGSYVQCFISQSTKINPKSYKNFEEVNYTAFIIDPLWITEKQYDFSIYTQENEKEGFKIPMRFPMRFVANDKKAIVDNNISSKTLAEITFYGPVTNPMIIIDNVPYSVEGTLLNNERYIIDQRDKSVVKVTSSGDIINSFNLRQKSPSVFDPIPEGKHIVGYDGSFSIRIILFEGSVEPSWN